MPVEVPEGLDLRGQKDFFSGGEGLLTSAHIRREEYVEDIQEDRLHCHSQLIARDQLTKISPIKKRNAYRSFCIQLALGFGYS